MTPNLAMKPDVKGMPAWANKNTVIANAKAGLSLPRPRNEPISLLASPVRVTKETTVKVPITKTE